MTSAFHVELLPVKCSLMVNLLHHQIPSGAASNSPSSFLADAVLNPRMCPLDARGENKSLCVWTAPFPRGFPRAACAVNKAPLFIQQLSKDQAQKLQCVKTPVKSQLPDPQSDVGMQTFPLFFYNMRTVNVTGSPQCKCFALTLIKIPYQLQATLEDVLLQTKQESGFSWTSHGILFHQHQFGFRP